MTTNVANGNFDTAKAGDSVASYVFEHKNRYRTRKMP